MNKDILQVEISDNELMQYRSNYNKLIHTRRTLHDRNDIYRAWDLLQRHDRFSATLRYMLYEAYPNPDVDW